MAKRIILCLDGTWNQPESTGGETHPTNVLKFMRALRTTGRDGEAQVVYYGRGVGTWNVLDRYLGGIGGVGLSRNVLSAYRWLVNNYQSPDDRIYIFGFSRGAYTARSLAGLIEAIGLMTKLEAGDLPRGYAYYRTPKKQRDGHPYHATAKAPERRYPRIACLGVFDTVGALGVPITALTFLNRRYRFHDVCLGSLVDNAFQALAVDEVRGPFEPAIWEKPDGWQGGLEQVWFAGVHSNIGGGYADARLSDIALRWLIARAMRCGLNFDREYRRAHIARKDLHQGAMGNSYRGVYRLYGRCVRKVRVDPAHGMSIHHSVFDRINDKPMNYQPENVEGGGQLRAGFDPSSTQTPDRLPDTT